MIKITGTFLLAVGFAMLAVALRIYDPAAPDANIGAGYLELTGLPLGILGLALVLVDAARAMRLRYRRKTRRQSWLPRSTGRRLLPPDRW